MILSLYLGNHNMPVPVWTPKMGFRIIRYPLHQVFAVCFTNLDKLSIHEKGEWQKQIDIRYHRHMLYKGRSIVNFHLKIYYLQNLLSRNVTWLLHVLIL